MEGGAALTKSALDELLDLEKKSVEQYGKGHGFYLDGTPSRREERSGIRQTLPRQCGVGRGIEVRDRLGSMRTDIRSYVFDNGPAVLLGLIADKTLSDPPGDMLHIGLGKKYHVCDAGELVRWVAYMLRYPAPVATP